MFNVCTVRVSNLWNLGWVYIIYVRLVWVGGWNAVSSAAERRLQSSFHAIYPSWHLSLCLHSHTPLRPAHLCAIKQKDDEKSSSPFICLSDYSVILSVSKKVMMRGDNIASTQQQGSPSTCCVIILGGGGVGEWRRRRWRGCRSASPDKWMCFCWVCVRWAGGKPMKWPNERWD